MATMKPKPKLGGARPGAGRKKKDGVKTSIYISKDAERLRSATADKLGVNAVAVLEMAIRDFAEKQGIRLEDLPEEIESE